MAHFVLFFHILLLMSIDYARLGHLADILEPGPDSMK